MILLHVALAAACALATGERPSVRVECDGIVDWKSLGSGASRLDMAGGVRLRRGTSARVCQPSCRLYQAKSESRLLPDLPVPACETR